MTYNQKMDLAIGFFVGVAVSLAIVAVVVVPEVGKKEALEVTGPFGDQFTVGLANGHVAVAGHITTKEIAKRFFLEKEIGTDGVVVEKIGYITDQGEKEVVFKRFQRLHSK